MGFWRSDQLGELPNWVLVFFAISYGLGFLGLYAQEKFSTNAVGTLGAGTIWVLLIYFNKVSWCLWLSIFGAVTGSIGGLFLIWATGFNSPAVLLGLCFIAYSLFWPFYFRRYLPAKKPVLATMASAPMERVSSLSRGVAEEVQSVSAETVNLTDESATGYYASELNLFEQGDLNEDLWAKHLVICEGDSEKAKWSYIKEKARFAADAEEEKKLLEAELAREQLAEIEGLKRETRAAQARQLAEVALTIFGFFLVFIFILVINRG
ncbi:hypothetical protein N9V47_05275 [Luminiphilus sp.]|nr:hypothetical protein [Luminiphilus sp.]MDB2313048.1 hypothetical protein [Luminiphilus sp.]